MVYQGVGYLILITQVLYGVYANADSEVLLSQSVDHRAPIKSLESNSQCESSTQISSVFAHLHSSQDTSIVFRSSITPSTSKISIEALSVDLKTGVHDEILWQSSHSMGSNNTSNRLINNYSIPLLIGPPKHYWPSFDASSKAYIQFGAEGNSHFSFVTRQAKSPRLPMIYQATDNGLLQAFEATRDLTTGGKGHEIYAHDPKSNNSLINLSLKSFGHTRPNQNHEASLSAGDVFVANKVGVKNWRTVLVGSVTAGDHALYALDITDPERFLGLYKKEDNVLWTFRHDNLGSAKHPGIMVMTQRGWAVIVGNGHNIYGDGRAKLFVLFLEGGLDGEWTPGVDFIEIDTGNGSQDQPNGLSAPSAIDVNDDAVVDYIYAGDIKGNMWVFDLTHDQPNNWSSRFGSDSKPKPLFSANDNQSIQSAPIVVRYSDDILGSNKNSNFLVLFATNQVELSTNEKGASYYYAVLDRGKAELTPAHLASRELSVVFSGNQPMRSVSGKPINWSSQYGWKLPLGDKITSSGESVAPGSILRNSALLFSSIVQDSNPCQSRESGWLTALQFNTGLALPKPIMDANTSGRIDSADHSVVSAYIDPIYHLRSAIINNRVYTSSQDGGLTSMQLYVNEREGRLSWEEVIQE